MGTWVPLAVLLETVGLLDLKRCLLHNGVTLFSLAVAMVSSLNWKPHESEEPVFHSLWQNKPGSLKFKRLPPGLQWRADHNHLPSMIRVWYEDAAEVNVPCFMIGARSVSTALGTVNSWVAVKRPWNTLSLNFKTLLLPQKLTTLQTNVI